MCQIEGHCYTHGDVSPGDEKASCDSLFSQNTWYRGEREDITTIHSHKILTGLLV